MTFSHLPASRGSACLEGSIFVCLFVKACLQGICMCFVFQTVCARLISDHILAYLCAPASCVVTAPYVEAAALLSASVSLLARPFQCASTQAGMGSPSNRSTLPFSDHVAPLLFLQVGSNTHGLVCRCLTPMNSAGLKPRSIPSVPQFPTLITTCCHPK